MSDPRIVVKQSTVVRVVRIATAGLQVVRISGATGSGGAPLSNLTPADLEPFGTPGVPGTSSEASRADHRHASPPRYVAPVASQLGGFQGSQWIVGTKGSPGIVHPMYVTGDGSQFNNFTWEPSVFGDQGWLTILALKSQVKPVYRGTLVAWTVSAGPYLTAVTTQRALSWAVGDAIRCVGRDNTSALVCIMEGTIQYYDAVGATPVALSINNQVFLWGNPSLATSWAIDVPVLAENLKGLAQGPPKALQYNAGNGLLNGSASALMQAPNYLQLVGAGAILEIDNGVTGYVGFFSGGTGYLSGGLTLGGNLAAANLAQPNGIATLDAGGKLPTTQLPDLAIVDHLGSVATQAAMLALVGQKGDWCIRTDLGTTWVITGTNPTLLASWTQLSYPAAPVTSVNGLTGAVSLSTTNIAEGTNLYWTTARFNTAFAGKSTTDLAEGSSLYFTAARAIAAPLTGFSATVGGAIVATDTVLQAFQRTQFRLAALEAGGFMVDPMTTAGDLVSRNAANATARLGIGTSRQILMALGTTLVPTWSNLNSADVTTALGFTPLSSAANQVANANLAQMAAGTLKGNNTGVTANALDLTVAQVMAMLAPFVASGASHAQGLVPDPGATAGTSRYLREDGTWTVPPDVGFANPMTTLGDSIYGGTAGAATRLAGNTTAAKYFMTQTGTGAASAAPAWGALGAADYPTMVGATGAVAGTKGAVPAPAATDNANFLRGDGTWAAAGGGGAPGGDLAGASIGAAVVKQASQDFKFTGILTPTALAADQNDYAPTGLSTASVVRLTASAAVNVTGLSGGAAGRILDLLNRGTNAITLKHEAAASLAANRFKFPTSLDFSLAPGAGLAMIWDGTDSRWVPFNMVASAVWNLHDVDLPPTSPSAYDDEFDTAAAGINTTLWANRPNWAGLTASDVSTTVPGALYVSNPTTGGTTTWLLRSALQAIPAGDFTIWTRLRVPPYLTNYVRCGLILSTTATAATGSQGTCEVIFNTTAVTYSVTGETWTNFNTYVGSIRAAQPYGYSSFVYLRIRRSGTSYFFGHSPDGLRWYEDAVTLGFTPSYFGLNVNNPSAAGSQDEKPAFDWFRYSSSATAVLGGYRKILY